MRQKLPATIATALARLPHRIDACIYKCAAYSVNTGVDPIRSSFRHFVINSLHNIAHCSLCYMMWTMDIEALACVHSFHNESHATLMRRRIEELRHKTKTYTTKH